MVVATAAFSILLDRAQLAAGCVAWLPARSSRPRLPPAPRSCSQTGRSCRWRRSWPPSRAVSAESPVSARCSARASGSSSPSTSTRTRPDARSGRIAAAGTLSGLVGALIADRIATLFGDDRDVPRARRAQRRVRVAGVDAGARDDGEHAAAFSEMADDEAMQAGSLLDATAHLAAASPGSGLRALTERPYLRNLAALRAPQHDGRHARRLRVQGAGGRRCRTRRALLRFFAVYYAATALIALARPGLCRPGHGARELGLALTTEHAVAGLLSVGGLAALAFPGIWSVAARQRQRVGVPRIALPHRLRDLLHAGAAGREARREVAHRRRLRPARRRARRRADQPRDPAAARSRIHYNAMIAIAVVCGALALIVARQLNRGYIQTLERSLIDRAVELDLSNVEDLTTRTAMLKTRHLLDADDAPCRPQEGVAETGHPDRRPRSAAHPRAPLAQPRPRACACSARRRACRPRSSRTSSRCSPGTRSPKRPCARCGKPRKIGSAI